ncbi:Protein kinase-like domain protein [Fusarium austroafricanum]|uniref:Protein kinase-like domain protein n=1 Tax=Fusarium austroafricanum TaxID=2364996 RepID=A0A8H4NUZ9_9HYPO|nr:Protein kinase-like domain protein [Fusarium austroafricanum]
MDGSLSVEELTRLLREAEQRAKEERQRAEEAERERQEERQRAEREQQRAEASEEQTRLTTLDEYIAACHASVFSRFAIETDPKLTSRGSIQCWIATRVVSFRAKFFVSVRGPTLAHLGHARCNKEATDQRNQQSNSYRGNFTVGFLA